MRAFKQNIALVRRKEREGDLGLLKRGGADAQRQHDRLGAGARPHLPVSRNVNASMADLLSEASWNAPGKIITEEPVALEASVKTNL